MFVTHNYILTKPCLNALAEVILIYLNKGIVLYSVYNCANTSANNIMAKKVFGFGAFSRDQEDGEQEDENYSITDKLGAGHPILSAFDDIICNNFKPCDNLTEADSLISTQDIYRQLQSHYKEKLLTIGNVVQLLREHNYTCQTVGSAQLWLFTNK